MLDFEKMHTTPMEAHLGAYDGIMLRKHRMVALVRALVRERDRELLELLGFQIETAYVSECVYVCMYVRVAALIRALYQRPRS